MFNFRSKKINFAEIIKDAEKLAQKVPAIKKRRQLNKTKKLIKYFIWLIVILLISLIIALLINFVSLKTIYYQALTGKSNLEKAISLIGQDNFSEAEEACQSAISNFNTALTALNNFKQKELSKRLPEVIGQLNSLESLLAAGSFLGQAINEAANFGDSLEKVVGGNKKLSFSKFSPAEKRLILKKIFESAPELNGIKANLDLVLLNLDQVEARRGLPLIFNVKINEFKEKINNVSQILAKAVPLSQLIPALAGYPKKSKFLVLLENSDELRPTGGFLGTYGLLSLKDGEISDFITHDVYHLDMPLEGKIKITPPAPLKKYLNENWYFRDANWSPDWPTAAKKLLWFYELESDLNPPIEKIAPPAGGFDGVIALTPALIIDLLKITGPISLEGVVYNKDNFTELLEYRVERGYQVLGVPKWQRKEVIGRLAREIKLKIMDLPAVKWAEAIKVLSDNLDEKNLLFYFTDGQLEKLAIDSGWGAEIKNTPSDYLYVVDANLAALKTDAVLSRGFNYKLSQTASGLEAKLTLNYSHNGKIDWKTSAYKSYTRIYVPLNSQLVKISSLDLSQVDSGVESGKTWFGFHLTVAPGQINNYLIKYKLPLSIINSGNYSLFLQKQPGKEIKSSVIDLSFLNKIKSYNPASLSVKRTSLNSLSWEGELVTDKSFQVNF